MLSSYATNWKLLSTSAIKGRKTAPTWTICLASFPSRSICLATAPFEVVLLSNLLFVESVLSKLLFVVNLLSNHPLRGSYA